MPSRHLNSFLMSMKPITKSQITSRGGRGASVLGSLRKEVRNKEARPTWPHEMSQTKPFKNASVYLHGLLSHRRRWRRRKVPKAPVPYSFLHLFSKLGVPFKDLLAACLSARINIINLSTVVIADDDSIHFSVPITEWPLHVVHTRR
jgi:hypothetical protein